MLEFSEYKNIIDLKPYNRPDYVTIEEREAVIDTLTAFFLAEHNENQANAFSCKDKRKQLKALFNIRPPKPLPQNLINLQDMLLWSEALDKGLVHEKQIAFSDNIGLWQGDITRLQIDAIVNAANSKMLGCFNPYHYCIDNVIHSSGGVQIREDCSQIMELQRTNEPTGKAKITRAYNLPSKYILHTVGTIVNGNVTDKNITALKNCYISCLELAKEMQLNTVAFCCISTGEFHYPKADACKIAVSTVKDWLKINNDMSVIFNVFLDEDKKHYIGSFGFGSM